MLPAKPRLIGALIVAILVVLVGRRVDAAPHDDPKAVDAEPLPPGAKLRLGKVSPSHRPIAALTPDFPTYLAPESADADIRYNPGTNPRINTGTVSPRRSQLLVSADGTRMVNLETDPLMVREVAATGKLVNSIVIPVKGTTGITSGNPVVALSGDGKVLSQVRQVFPPGLTPIEVYVWDVDKNQERAKVTVAQTSHVAAILSRDGNALATWGTMLTQFPNPPGGGNAGKFIQVWDTNTGKEITRLHYSGAYPNAVVFSPNGALIAASAGDGVIDLWDAKTGKGSLPLLGRSRQGLKIAFSPSGDVIASLGADGSVQRWATADGKPLETTECPLAIPYLTIGGLRSVSADRFVAWGTMGPATTAWEAPSGKLLTIIGEHSSEINSIAFPPGGNEILTSGGDSRIVRWDLKTGRSTGIVPIRQTRNLRLRPERQPDLSLSPNAAFGISPDAEVYDLAMGAELFSIPHTRDIHGYRSRFLSPDYTRIAFLPPPPGPAESKFLCVVWDIAARRKVIELVIPGTRDGAAAAFSPDGKRLVTAVSSPKGPLARRLYTGWDLETGKKLGEFDEPYNSPWIHLTAANSTSAVVVLHNGELWGLDFEVGQKGELIDKGAGIYPMPVVFSPDGTRFAAAVGTTAKSGGYGVRVYDWPRGKLLHTFVGHTELVTRMAFSPDGKTLASGSRDKTVLLWDMTKVPAPK